MCRGIRKKATAEQRTGPAIGLAATALSLLIIGCAEKQAEEPPPVSRPVKVITMGAAGAGNVVEYPGVIAATQDATLAFEVSGRIISFPVNEGQQVSKGTMLARLDPKDYEAARDREAAKRNSARSEYQRIRELYESNVVSLREFDKARRDLEVTEANLRPVEKALNDTYLRATFDGVVARRLVEEFENVQAKQNILVLQDISGLEVKIDVPEQWWSRVRPDVSFEERTATVVPMISLAMFPDHTFQGRFKEVATTADPVTRTFRVTIAFDPPDDIRIMPGMTARVTVTTEYRVGSKKSHLVPAFAVVGDNAGEPFVWTIDSESGTATRTHVDVGEMSGDEIEITAGLSPGDQVIVSGVQSLSEGMPVRPTE